MLAVQVRDVIQNLQNPIWPHDLWPACAQIAAKTANRDGWESVIEGIRLAGVNVIGGAVKAVACRILAAVLALENLIVMGVANPGFVHPSGIRGPSPTSRKHLRTSVLIRQPQCIRLGAGSIVQNSAAWADEVHGAQRVFVAEVVVHFSQSGINSIRVWQSVRYRKIGASDGRKESGIF